MTKGMYVRTDDATSHCNKARDALVRAAAALTEWPSAGAGTASDTLAFALLETSIALLFITKMDESELAHDKVVAALQAVRDKKAGGS